MSQSNTRLKVGEGIISGYVSIFLGILSLLAVLCFHFPELFTTPEFRKVYTAESMKILLFSVIIASFLFAVLSFLLSHRKKYALFGLLFCVITIAIGGFDVQGKAVEKTSWYIGLDWLLLDLFIMAVIFVPIEMVFPKNTNQSRFHPEWKTDLIYFAISHLFVQFFGVITQKPATVFFGWIGFDQFHIWVQSLPFIVEFFLALFVTDLFQYWAHRIFHSNSYLWRFHSIHHSTVAMDWLAGSRTHFIDIFFTRSMSFIPLYIFGFSEITFNAYIIFIAIHAVLIHANTNIRFGFLKYLITTPQYHHWHHCEDPRYYGKNFAVVFPFIDKMFGTYYLPGDVWPEGTGLKDANYPKGYISQLTFPFANNPFRKESGDE